ncbi:hypothetical protein N7492_006615 [Penicillium capsulatum]|uniref:Uncharacterized protein n=1 Tax=Penicillium capsulatum TaxID=69766 RepID=A0A9W9LL19_9EURO|nr:hypothetical protein N7492_006615 [Penicillium capsulatum]KAJ6116450.1 hypothetical protein N7512_006175 [Penicillium capsulatum]
MVELPVGRGEVELAKKLKDKHTETPSDFVRSWALLLWAPPDFVSPKPEWRNLSTIPEPRPPETAKY